MDPSPYPPLYGREYIVLGDEVDPSPCPLLYGREYIVLGDGDFVNG